MARSLNSAADRPGERSVAPEPMDDVRVWDVFVRVFHWTLVVIFLAAYLTGDDLLRAHVWAGYLVGVLVVLRIVWGFVGSRHARFTNFVYRPRKVVRYARDLMLLGGRRYLGHSPAGGAMVVVLLAMILLIVVTGFLAFAALDGGGPLAGYIAVDRASGRAWKEVHEFVANVTFGLVLLHICGVLWASLVHGENLILAMWNGRKRVHNDRCDLK